MASRKQNSRGFWYWILIGWWFEPLKWFLIGLYKLIKWFVTNLPVWIEKTTKLIEANLEKSGKNFSHNKIKAGVSFGFLLLLVFSCLGMSALAQSNTEIEPTIAVANTELIASSTVEIIHKPTNTYVPLSMADPAVSVPAIKEAACVPTDTLRQQGKVTKVIDGDTIHVEIDGVDYKVRYIGMDAPETGKAGAVQATLQNEFLVMGKTVTLVKDVSETDKYDRLLRYVFIGKSFVNYELVAKGVAVAGSWPPDTSCDETFANAQGTARVNQLGLWAPTTVPPTVVIPTRIPATALIPTRIPSTALPLVTYPTNTAVINQGSNCDPAYPDVCIPSPPPDLDCKEIPYHRFRVLPPDPHHFDGDGDGIGCES